MGGRIEASWLSTRRAADARARDASLPLVQSLANHLAAISAIAASQAAVHIVDVGAGTGANADWLAPRLRSALTGAGVGRWAHHWYLLDHDPDLLAARHLNLPARDVQLSEHVGGLSDVAALLAVQGRPRVLTCSALLDLLTPDEITELVTDTVRSADGALFALSVTGAIALDPADEQDYVVSDLFNAHQQARRTGGARRGTTPTDSGPAGPAGWTYAVGAFEAAGWRVQQVATPWRLGPAARDLSNRLLSERSQAAAEMAPDAHTRGLVEGWLARRLHQLDDQGLGVRVDHMDVLALPPRSTSVQMSSPNG
ncbi:trans-aconitate methyltransferase [soil metagenome]